MGYTQVNGDSDIFKSDENPSQNPKHEEYFRRHTSKPGGTWYLSDSSISYDERVRPASIEFVDPGDYDLATFAGLVLNL